MVVEVLAVWPTPTQLQHPVKLRINAKHKKHGVRRLTDWAGS